MTDDAAQQTLPMEDFPGLTCATNRIWLSEATLTMDPPKTKHDAEHGTKHDTKLSSFSTILKVPTHSPRPHGFHTASNMHLGLTLGFHAYMAVGLSRPVCRKQPSNFLILPSTPSEATGWNNKCRRRRS